MAIIGMTMITDAVIRVIHIIAITIGHITITHIIGNHQGYFGSPQVGD